MAYNQREVRFEELTLDQKFDILGRVLDHLSYGILIEETPDYTGLTLTQKCTACNGSGHYDAKGSPKCSACQGTGYKEVW